MAADGSRALRVGTVATVALAILAVLVFRLSSESGFFRGRVRYETRFPTSQGLSEGAEVRYKGVRVGTVERIDFAAEPQLDDIIVTLAVRPSVATRIDRHVVAELRTNGPLGDRLLELRRPDVPPAEPLPEGSRLPSKPPFEFGTVVDEGTDVLSDIRSISQSLAVITTRLVEGEGLFGRLLKDQEFGDRTITDLEVTISRLREIVESSAEGRNLVGALLADEDLATEVSADLQASLDHLERITGRLDRGEGALGRLLSEESELAAAADDVAESARRLREVTGRLEAAEGSLFHRLFLDEDYGEQVATELHATLVHVRSIAEKLDEGDGTAGAFLNDRRVYEGINDIVTGVERSWFINFILRRKQKRGFRERVDRILAESEDPDRELLELVREVLAAEDDAARPEAPDEGTAAAGGAP